MNETKSFASLSPSLLARKGAARPAMRPQLQPYPVTEQERPPFAAYPHSIDAASSDSAGDNDLGWNDIAGEDVAVASPQPEVLRQIETLADAMRAPAQPQSEPKAKLKPKRAPQPSQSPRGEGGSQDRRKAAFTLRLEAHRHLRLRLACAVENRSAQQLVSEALDLFLETMPGLEDLAQRARQS